MSKANMVTGGAGLNPSPQPKASPVGRTLVNLQPRWEPWAQMWEYGSVGAQRVEVAGFGLVW